MGQPQVKSTHMTLVKASAQKGTLNVGRLLREVAYNCEQGGERMSKKCQSTVEVICEWSKRKDKKSKEGVLSGSAFLRAREVVGRLG